MSNIVGTTPNGYDYRFSPHGVNGLEYNGNQYVFAAEGNESIGDLKLHVLKSTNSGVSWTDLTSVTISGTPAVTICQDGSTVYILSTDTLNGGAGTDQCAALLSWTFNLTNDTINVNSVSGPTIYKYWHGAIPTGFQVDKCVGISLLRRGTGSFWFIYQGLPETRGGSKFARMYVASFDGSSFGSGVQIDGQTGDISYTPGGAGIDVNGNLHIIVANNVFKNYYHIGMNAGGVFGTFQTVESDGFFVHLDPPEEVSNVLNFNISGDKIGFIGVNNPTSDNGDIILYYGNATLNPTWSKATIHADDAAVPVVVNASMGCGLSTGLGLIDGNLHAFWTVSGVTPTWHTSAGLGIIAHSSANLAALGSWAPADTSIAAPGLPAKWSAAQINVWPGSTIGLAVLGSFSDNTARTQLSLFNVIASSGGGGTTPLTELVTDSLPAFSDIIGVYCSIPNTVSDTNNNWADSVATQMSGISGGTPPAIPGGPLPDRKLPPNSPPVAGTSCIFEFYGMETPEEVEVLPVPKKYDQLGPMRFDKIGKIFGFRVRLIPNGSISSMPYAIYGDDSESSPHLNSPLFSGTFPVRSGYDNVYEIQLPKSINTDIFRLTLGPTTDSFHRYNVLVKVHISGMQGQAKWLPIR